MKLLKAILLIFIGLIVIGVIVGPQKEDAVAQDKQASSPGTATGDSESQAKPAAIFTTTAAELARAYEDNTVAADQRFKGARYEVSGIVASIDTDFLGRPYVTLRGGVNEFMEPQFSFSKQQASVLAKLHKGNKVTMVCTGRGDVAKTAMSDDCVML